VIIHTRDQLQFGPVDQDTEPMMSSCHNCIGTGRSQLR
jgi:hypothetical protein